MKMFRPKDCLGCDVPLRPSGVLAKYRPGTYAHKAKGYCATCYHSERKAALAHETRFGRHDNRVPLPAPIMDRMRRTHFPSYEYIHDRRKRGIPAAGKPLQE